MSDQRLALGREGELRAARHLEQRGYQIVGRNVRAARVEIDLIARTRDALVFVEVKTRRRTGSSRFGSHAAAREAVSLHKQARLRRGAAAWLASRRAGTHPRRVRFDVITCLREDGVGAGLDQSCPQIETTAPREEARWSIEHLEAAF